MASAAVRDQVAFALPDGRPVRAFRLGNDGGMAAVVLEYGAILTSLRVPDAPGRIDDVVLFTDA